MIFELELVLFVVYVLFSAVLIKTRVTPPLFVISVILASILMYFTSTVVLKIFYFFIIIITASQIELN